MSSNKKYTREQKISSCMKRNVVSISPETTIREAAAILVNKHVGLLPVVDDSGEVIGVLGLRDLLGFELPDFVKFVEDLDFVPDFGAVELTRPGAEVVDQPVASLMKKDVVTVDEECGLLRAYALLLQSGLHDLPVISQDGKLLGIASRVDVGAAILSRWSTVEDE